MTHAIKAILTAIHSKRDRNGNTEWAFTFTDCKTGQTVKARVSGGESNINAIALHWNAKGWDSSIWRQTQALPIREFNRLVKDWPYAGCDPSDLAAFVRKSLA